MKKTGAALICFLLFLTAKAQIKVAIAGGVQSASVKEDNNLPGWDSLKNNYSSRQGFHFGLIANIPFSARSHFSFQPAVMFSNKGRNFSAKYDTSVNAISTVSALQFINYMDIPLNLVLKMRLAKKTNLVIGGGPYISFLYNGREKKDTYFKNGTFQTEENTDLEVGNSPGQYKNFDYGANALFGFELGKVFLRATYSLGLNDFYQASGYDGTFRHQVIGATFGISLGKPSDLKEKPKDSDDDGIADLEDGCPAEKGDIATKGCPDKDGDGIANKDDNCPETTGLLKYKGCPPPDTDKDGVNDEEDKCVQIPGLKKYNGCPAPDSDNDGINDEEDTCPAVSGLKKYSGCPIPDTDKDGINDEEDKCPTEAGTKGNNGCPEPKPEIKKEIIKKVNYAASKIQFEFRSAKLLPESYPVLNNVAKILKTNPELRVSIEGHTSNDGIYNNNIKLSQDRANNVKKYFESLGIESSRLEAKGFGPTKPLNKGKTEAEKALNRRVELKLSN